MQIHPLALGALFLIAGSCRPEEGGSKAPAPPPAAVTNASVAMVLDRVP